MHNRDWSGCVLGAGSGGVCLVLGVVVCAWCWEWWCVLGAGSDVVCLVRGVVGCSQRWALLVL
jgi:hypothetical protein